MSKIRTGDLVEYIDDIRRSGKYKERAKRLFLVTSLASMAPGYMTVITPGGKRKILNAHFLQKVIDKVD